MSSKVDPQLSPPAIGEEELVKDAPTDSPTHAESSTSTPLPQLQRASFAASALQPHPQEELVESSTYTTSNSPLRPWSDPPPGYKRSQPPPLLTRLKRLSQCCCTAGAPNFSTPSSSPGRQPWLPTRSSFCGQRTADGATSEPATPVAGGSVIDSEIVVFPGDSGRIVLLHGSSIIDGEHGPIDDKPVSLLVRIQQRADDGGSGRKMTAAGGGTSEPATPAASSSSGTGEQRWRRNPWRSRCNGDPPRSSSSNQKPKLSICQYLSMAHFLFFHQRTKQDMTHPNSKNR
ncbi:hypothetical protein ACLOJK_005257 [Asimina triloba]